MTFVDAFGLVALILDEPAAPEVEALLRGEDAAIASITLAETVDVLERVRELPSSEVHEVIDPLAAGPLKVVPVTEDHAWRAADIRARYYHRRDAPLSLADCVLLAMAAPPAALATADPVVARTARAEGLTLIALRDSEGRRP